MISCFLSEVNTTSGLCGDKPYSFRTYSGRQFDFSNLSKDDIVIEDIAHGLSMIPRFGGHSKVNYSVARHSLIVALLTPDPYKLHALLYDASKAYLGDMIKPLKMLPGLEGYRSLEKDLQELIYEKFLGVKQGIPDIVKHFDYVAYRLEEAKFVRDGILQVDLDLSLVKGTDIIKTITTLSAILNANEINIERSFLALFNQLIADRGA